MTVARAGHGLAVTLNVLCDELERRGHPPRELLSRLGMKPPRSVFERIARNDVLVFADAAIALSGDPGFHVAATANAALGAFHLADTIAMMAPTLGFGMRAAMDGFGVFNSGCAWQVDEREDPIVATLSPTFEALPHHVDIECAFTAFANRSRTVSDGQHGPLWLEIGLPDRGAGGELARACRCPVHYDRPQSRYVTARNAWEFRPRFGQPLVAGLVRTGSELLGALPHDFLATLRQRIGDGLRSGRTGVGEIAERLGLSVRSMQRRLSESGTSFHALVDEERHRLALELARRDDLSVAQIADLLGFSETSALTRAFRRWTGVSPREWRARPGKPEESR